MGARRSGREAALQMLFQVEASSVSADQAIELFWRTFVETASMNPKATKIIIMQMAFYLHLGPFSRKTIEHIESRIREMERRSSTSPQAAQFVGLARP